MTTTRSTRHMINLNKLNIHHFSNTFLYAQSTAKLSLRNSRFHHAVLQSPVIHVSEDQFTVKTGDNTPLSKPAEVSSENILYYFLKAQPYEKPPPGYIKRSSIIWLDISENTTLTHLYFNHIDGIEPEGCCIFVSMPRKNIVSDVRLGKRLTIRECSFSGVRSQYEADEGKSEGSNPNYNGFCLHWEVNEIGTGLGDYPTNQVYLYNLLFANCARSINYIKSAAKLDLPKYMGIIAGVNRNLTVTGANFTRLTLFDYDFTDIFRAGSTGIIMVLDQFEGTPREFTADFKFVQFCHMRQVMGSLFIAYPVYQNIVPNPSPKDNPIISVTFCNFINASFGQMTPAQGGVFGHVGLKSTIVVSFVDCFFKKTAFYGTYRMYTPNLYSIVPHIIFTRLYCTLDPYKWLTPRVDVLGNTVIQFTFSITENYFVLGDEPREVFGEGVVNMTFVIPPNVTDGHTRLFTPSAPYPPIDDKKLDYNKNVNNVAGVLAVIFGGFSLLYFLFTLYTRNSAGKQFHGVGDFVAFYSLAHGVSFDKNFRPIEIPEEEDKKDKKQGKGKGSGSGFSMSTYHSYRSGYGYSRGSYSYCSYGSNAKRRQSGGESVDYNDVNNSDYSSEIGQVKKDNSSDNEEVVGSGGNDRNDNNEGSSNEYPQRDGRNRPAVGGNCGYSDEGYSDPPNKKVVGNGNGGYSGDGYSDPPNWMVNGNRNGGDDYSDGGGVNDYSRGKGGCAKKVGGNGGYSGDGYSLEDYEYSDQALPPLQRRPIQNKVKIDPKAIKGGKSHKGKDKHRGNHKSPKSSKKQGNAKLPPLPPPKSPKKEDFDSFSLPPPPWADGIPTDPNEKRLFDTTQTLSNTSDNQRSHSRPHSKPHSQIDELKQEQEQEQDEKPKPSLPLPPPPPPPPPKRRNPYFQIPSVTSRSKRKDEDSSSSSSYTCYSSSVSK